MTAALSARIYGVTVTAATLNVMAVAAVIQRPLRGSRVSTFYPVKTLPLLSSLDSAFQLQEYISLLIRYNVHDVERIVALPGKPDGKDKEKDNEESAETKNEEKDLEKVKGDVTVDEACWIYEQLRLVTSRIKAR